MAKSSRKTSLKNFGKDIKKTIPVVGKGLKKLGTSAKDVAVKTAPVVEKGVSVVYGTMAKGFDLGIQGVRSIAKGISKRKRSKRGSKRTRRH